MSVLKTLTEGIVERDLSQESNALLNKWEKTGLLEGLDSDYGRQSMSRLLENQAKQLLKEASSMAAGDVEGFSSVAFPIVRRVFGGLIANDLVSVQPMSLPSGLIFFLDFTYSDTRFGNTDNKSIYGTDRVAKQITGGVNLVGDFKESNGGPYFMGGAYSSPTGSVTLANSVNGAVMFDNYDLDDATDAQKKNILHDADILSLSGSATKHAVVQFEASASLFTNANLDLLSAWNAEKGELDNMTGVAGTNLSLIRRLTRKHPDAAKKDTHLLFTVFGLSGSSDIDAGPGGAVDAGAAVGGTIVMKYPLKDKFESASAIGAVVGADPWGLEEATNVSGASPASDAVDSKDLIPEIDIKVDSIAVTAMTKKLKAKWSPELGQDLNAYHNLDAEVELTSILSEQIALEIDREILGDLVNGATAGTFYWSRSPGLFLNRTTGAEIGASAKAPDFTGTVSEWYETLIETINDVSAQIHRKTLRGGANYVVCSPEIANILEFTSGFRASVTADVDKGDIGAIKAGSLSKKFEVYVDPYFHRNLILVGRKGSSFLESGYVYSPYVPLQVTPTIFGVEDFVPRKGVMTRYAKKMVRPDMYGLVVVRGLLGESGQ